MLFSVLAWNTQSFLVKSATGGKTSNIAGAQRICCACEMISLTISLWLASCLWLRIQTVIQERTAGSNLWPSSLLSSLKIHYPPQPGDVQYTRSGLLNSRRPSLFFTFFKAAFLIDTMSWNPPLHQQRKYSWGNPLEKMSRSTTRGFILQVLGANLFLCFYLDACLKHIKTKTGSMISHGE